MEKIIVFIYDIVRNLERVRKVLEEFVIMYKNVIDVMVIEF